MRVTLEREGEIKVFDAITTLRVFEEERPDIYSIIKIIDERGVDYQYLQDEIGGTASKIVVDGIIKYLKNMMLLDRSNNLTKLAKRYLDSKKFPSIERGKFKFWIIYDPLIGWKLLHYDREGVTDSYLNISQEGKFSAKNLEGKYYGSILNSCRFYLYKFERYNTQQNISYTEFSNLTTRYRLSWEIDLDKEDLYRIYLTGNLKKRPNKSNKFTQKVMECKVEVEDFEEIILNLLSINVENFNWNREIGALEVSFNEELSRESRVNLRKDIIITDASTKFGVFEPTFVNDVELMPATADDALNWLEYLMTEYLSQGYSSIDDFYQKLDMISESPKFKDYNQRFEEFDQDRYLENMKKENKTEEYWNLQAPLDLTPEIDNAFVLYKKDIASGSKYTMKELVEMIIGSKKPEELIFSSRYIRNKYQKAKFNLFVESFSELGSISYANVVSEELVDSKWALPETYDRVYGHRKNWPHDRYFSFKVEGEWYYYKMTAELDQCNFGNLPISEWTINSEGTWSDISFIQLDEEAFPKGLRNYMEKEDF